MAVYDINGGISGENPERGGNTANADFMGISIFRDIFSVHILLINSSYV